MHAGAFLTAAGRGALFKPPRGLPADMPTVIVVEDDETAETEEEGECDT